jgi:enamine deaminase RidA (YjgF/YER057c/UK114 family)/N-acetylglutamate synthase-like GNAT family acetyltransferase
MADGRVRIATGTPWEPLVGYSRAVRVGERVWVTGTTATLPGGGHAAAGDAGAQARQCLANIGWALARAGSSLDDVVRTRIFVTDIRSDWEAVGRAHAEALGPVRPATSMVEVSRLIDEWMKVEIEADAVVPAGRVMVAIDPETEEDGDAVRVLLERAGLPVRIDADQPVAMRVARVDGRVVACGGFERAGREILVRSIAVEEGRRGQGLGALITRAILAEARASGVEAAWLFTVSSASFFEKLGFARADRAGAAEVVQRSRQAAVHGACADAVLMSRGV